MARGLKRGPDQPLRRSARWTAARRETYFAVLAETGNARCAAEAIGMDPGTLRARRRKDPDFARDYEAAIAAADAGLADDDGTALDPFEAIRPGPDGRLQIVAVGQGHWNGRVERQFLDHLRAHGNMSAAARAVGFTPETVWARRRQHQGFAAAIETVLDEAELELELRLATEGNAVAAAAPGSEPAPAPAPFDPEFALKFLKWREEKRQGRGGRGRGDRAYGVRTLEEVQASILRKLHAVAEHRRRQAEKDAPRLMAEVARQWETGTVEDGDGHQ